MDELLHLLDIQSMDSVLFLGDLVDRGPDPGGVLRRIQESNGRYRAIIGNHDERHVKYARRMQEQEELGKPNKMKTSESFLKTHAQVKPHLEWLSKLPHTHKLINFKTNTTIYAVHAGFMPHVPIEKQNKNLMTHIRNVTLDGRKIVHLYNEDDYVGNIAHWSDVWEGPFTVYGHSVFENVKYSKNAVGIDTGCCFGGSLTAYVFDCDTGTAQIVSVKAKRAYSEPWKKEIP
jgi:diadenosine tetraphosphatase ApaH/serine/threonine PP2A family protein phosphatase